MVPKRLNNFVDIFSVVGNKNNTSSNYPNLEPGKKRNSQNTKTSMYKDVLEFNPKTNVSVAIDPNNLTYTQFQPNKDTSFSLGGAATAKSGGQSKLGRPQSSQKTNSTVGKKKSSA